MIIKIKISKKSFFCQLIQKPFIESKSKRGCNERKRKKGYKKLEGFSWLYYYELLFLFNIVFCVERIKDY